jgi:hypothetical protein
MSMKTDVHPSVHLHMPDINLLLNHTDLVTGYGPDGQGSIPSSDKKAFLYYTVSRQL